MEPIISSGSKAIKAAFSSGPNVCSHSSLFSHEDDAGWNKGHGRIERSHIARAEVSPEQIGLCGCWQVIAVRRERIQLGPKANKNSDEIGYYAASVGHKELTDQEVLKAIRDHWAAVESGSHYRRDVTFNEDKSRVSKRGAAQVMATFKNLAIGIFELEKERGRTKSNQLTIWSRRLKATTALKLIQGC